MLDPTIGWYEIVQWNYKQTDTIANLVETLWSCMYPRPTIIMENSGNGFLGNALKNDIIIKIQN